MLVALGLFELLLVNLQISLDDDITRLEVITMFAPAGTFVNHPWADHSQPEKYPSVKLWSSTISLDGSIT